VTFADALKKARADRDQNQASAAKVLGVSQNTISSWERGETMPRLWRLRAVAKKLGLDYVKFLGDYTKKHAA
jgi:transcriptional regulator with XRE-family HTH domain